MPRSGQQVSLQLIESWGKRADDRGDNLCRPFPDAYVREADLGHDLKISPYSPDRQRSMSASRTGPPEPEIFEPRKISVFGSMADEDLCYPIVSSRSAERRCWTFHQLLSNVVVFKTTLTEWASEICRPIERRDYTSGCISCKMLAEEIGARRSSRIHRFALFCFISLGRDRPAACRPH